MLVGSGVLATFGVAVVLSACARNLEIPGAALTTSLQPAATTGPLVVTERNARALSHALQPMPEPSVAMAGLDFATRIASPQAGGTLGLDGDGPCPRNMAAIGDFCIDRYEASLVEVLPGGLERPFPHFEKPAGARVRAVSEANAYPQAYISAQEAGQACAASGKRLCKTEEWRSACRGPSQTRYPYGNTRQSGSCNDHGRAPLAVVYRGDSSVYGSWEKMNDPALNQVEGTLARSGEHESCTNDYGVYDMVGNVHEWVADPNGTFLGGYYLDTKQNGEGCGYTTDRHNTSYHDYSTGFRCCADQP